jgi:hypothetical protein
MVAAALLDFLGFGNQRQVMFPGYRILGTGTKEQAGY